MDSEPVPPAGRQGEIDARLGAIRARLETLRERDPDAVSGGTGDTGERLTAARRYAAEAHTAAVAVLASSAEAFRAAAGAHERTADAHERAAAAGVGDVGEHERQAALHRAAAAVDRQRAEHALSLLSGHKRAGPADVSDEPPDGVAP